MQVARRGLGRGRRGTETAADPVDSEAGMASSEAMSTSSGLGELFPESRCDRGPVSCLHRGRALALGFLLLFLCGFVHLPVQHFPTFTRELSTCCALFLSTLNIREIPQGPPFPQFITITSYSLPLLHSCPLFIKPCIKYSDLLLCLCIS